MTSPDTVRDSESRRPHELLFGTKVETAKAEKVRQIEAVIRLSVAAKPETPSGPGDILHVEAAFQLTYRLTSFEGLTDEMIHRFGEINGIYNVWPYWRELVQSMTVRMGFPALTIPVFRLTEQDSAAGATGTRTPAAKGK